MSLTEIYKKFLPHVRQLRKSLASPSPKKREKCRTCKSTQGSPCALSNRAGGPTGLKWATEGSANLMPTNDNSPVNQTGWGWRGGNTPLSCSLPTQPQLQILNKSFEFMGIYHKGPEELVYPKNQWDRSGVPRGGGKACPAVPGWGYMGAHLPPHPMTNSKSITKKFLNDVSTISSTHFTFPPASVMKNWA